MVYCYIFEIVKSLYDYMRNMYGINVWKFEKDWFECNLYLFCVIFFYLRFNDKFVVYYFSKLFRVYEDKEWVNFVLKIFNFFFINC